MSSYFIAGPFAGTVVGMTLSGTLAEAYGWPAIFYFFGTIMLKTSYLYLKIIFILVLLVSSTPLPYNYGRSINEAQYFCYVLKYVTKQKVLESHLED